MVIKLFLSLQLSMFENHSRDYAKIALPVCHKENSSIGFKKDLLS
jgi:hypothetical protein